MKIVYKKWFLFCFGIFVGFIVGSSINWWQSPEKFGIFKIKKYLSSLFVEDSALFIDLNKKNLEVHKKTTTKKANIAKSNDTLSCNYLNAADSIRKNKNYPEVSIKDSLKGDTIYTGKYNASFNHFNDANLIGDQLVFERVINFRDISNNNNRRNRYIDSLLTDDFSDNSKNENIYKIEFWKSPVNYKGYKYGKNKIILFGISNNDAKFQTLDNNIYLFYGNQYYLIDKTSDFKPFIAISNKGTISQLTAKKNEN